MRCSQHIMLFLVQFLSGVICAQNLEQDSMKITGVVTDENGYSLSNTTVCDEITNTATNTDAIGHFALTSKQGDMLAISHVGYVPQELMVQKDTGLKIRLYQTIGSVDKIIAENELKTKLLKRESLIRYILTAVMMAIFVITLLVFRNIHLRNRHEHQQREILEDQLKMQQLENEKKEAAFQQQKTELEMQALVAQMNPHFIFNSLNSINCFILKNNKEDASEYLIKFSKLMRLILQNSQASAVLLESALEVLKLYLELEVVRFDYHFDYSINIGADIDITAIKIPSLIMQPYAENAIWHGLMHKEEKGHLRIDLFKKNEKLYYKITDDGIGRKKAEEFKSKSRHKSVGMRITANRIALLQQQKQTGTSIQITDIVLPDGSAGGTEVLIEIPIEYE